ncbi:MAG: dTDP-4-dehydrorhamnose 3,5-epimerase family protein [Planctomycetota bacterium]|jgi:dTDP-4-dehydrorhamnose 3,5-epimerase
MKILETRDLAIPEVKVIRYARFRDDRGYFTETFRLTEIAEALGASEFTIAQANESFSKAGVFRGLHAQWNPNQGKLVRCVSGRLIDLAVDIRKGSPTFGGAVAHSMPESRDSGGDEWIWIPPGFVHGTMLTEDSVIEYLCTGAWSPGCEISVSPLAEDIDWSPCDQALRDEVHELLDDAILTGKDRDGLTLAAWTADPRSDWFVYSPGAPWSVTSTAE